MSSSGHLRRCSDAVTSNKCLNREKDASILSWPTVTGHKKLLIAIFTACPHQVTYDVVATPIRRTNA
eukprot:scaffold25365_cov96-Skeletonema_marinoi.AAC.1